MRIKLLPSANPAYALILSVEHGKGDANLLCWLASRADEFKLRTGRRHWLIQVRCTSETARNFIKEFRDQLAPSEVPA